jgi:hypothetical protein
MYLKKTGIRTVLVLALGAGTPHFTETQQEPPIAPPAPYAPLMPQSQPATAPVYHAHEAEINLSGNNGQQSTFDRLKQGV